ncbi:MAG: hypothetical protein OXC93_03980 [Rhodospirillaceae bacterium]|nr:hypothetical protein [Rhodospirillaceae bacterium]
MARLTEEQSIVTWLQRGHPAVERRNAATYPASLLASAVKLFLPIPDVLIAGLMCFLDLRSIAEGCWCRKIVRSMS